MCSYLFMKPRTLTLYPVLGNTSDDVDEEKDLLGIYVHETALIKVLPSSYLMSGRKSKVLITSP